MTFKAFGQYLFTSGIYHTTTRHGVRIPAVGATIFQLLEKAKRDGLMA